MRLCEDWITPEQLLACECPDPANPEVLQRWIDAATEVIFLLSGSIYGGVCEATWRPLVTCAPPPGWRRGSYPSVPLLINGNWLNTGGCGCIVQGLLLPFDYPRQVTEVLIDGDTIDPSRYRFDSVSGRLYLEAGLNWPHQQDLSKATTEPNTFAITLTYGISPPASLVQAAIDYAVELGRGCSGLACRLPARAVSIVKQGVSIDFGIVQQMLDKGRTGLVAVDSALAAINPKALRQRARFYSPDLPMPLA